MRKDILSALSDAPVVPLIQSDDPESAVRTARALVAGGLSVHEVVLRTDEALACLAAIAERVDDAIVGAGTVLSTDQAQRSLDAGAEFIVSPGLDEGVVDLAKSAQRPIYPGVATATEVQRAWNLGLRTVKFFPASINGGPQAIKALAGVFRDMQFMPTGGVSASNLAEYLAERSVVACGGSWLTPADAVGAGDFDRVTRLAEEAVRISRQVRG
ncbi:MAG: bifunctional 4-hydroxy-2-oxoglutarate aldolase/2-dehydro-3-deoxy-phosphogluconate aldolase [Pseudomonadota bacterium]